MGVFVLKSRRWGRTSSVLGGPYGVGSKGSLWVPTSPGSAEATVPGPSPLGTRSAWQCTSCRLIRPTIVLVVWVFRDRGCSVGGHSPIFSLEGQFLGLTPTIPYVSLVTVYSLGPLPIFTVAPPAPPPYPGALGEALTGGVPGSLILFLNCMGNPNVSSNWSSKLYIWFFFEGRCWLSGSDILHHLQGSLSFLSLPVLWCGSRTDRGIWLSTQQMLISLSGTIVGDPLGLLHQ